MGQSVFVWVVVFETPENKKVIDQYTCTWVELQGKMIEDDREPIAIIRTDTWIKA